MSQESLIEEFLKLNPNLFKSDEKIKKLPKIEGIVSEIQDAILKTLKDKDHNSSLGAAIAIFSMMIGHKSILIDGSDYETTTNNYYAFIKPSGSGKTILLNRIKRFCESQLNDFKFNNDIIFTGKHASAASLSMDLQDNSVICANFDEFSTILNSITNKKVNINLDTLLMQLWDSANREQDLTMSKAAKKDLQKQKINKCNFNIIAATTITKFKADSDTDMLSSGFYNRFLFFIDVPEISYDPSPISPSAFAEFDIISNSIRSLLKDKNFSLTSTDGYLKLLSKEGLHQRKFMSRQSDESYARRISHAQKIAQIHALSKLSETNLVTEITEDDLAFGIQFYDTLMKNTEEIFDAMRVSGDPIAITMRSIEKVLMPKNKILDEPICLTYAVLRNKLVGNIKDVTELSLDKALKLMVERDLLNCEDTKPINGYPASKKYSLKSY